MPTRLCKLSLNDGILQKLVMLRSRASANSTASACGPPYVCAANSWISGDRHCAYHFLCICGLILRVLRVEKIWSLGLSLGSRRSFARGLVAEPSETILMDGKLLVQDMLQCQLWHLSYCKSSGAPVRAKAPGPAKAAGVVLSRPNAEWQVFESFEGWKDWVWNCLSKICYSVNFDTW